MKHFKLFYSFAVILAAILFSLAVSSVILILLGADVLKTFEIVFIYPLTTPKNLSGVINIMTPLVLVGTGICVAYRTGIVNIGGEGQMIMGLLCALVFAIESGMTGPVAFFLTLLVGAMGGAVWGIIAGVLKTSFGVSELLSTVMLNYIATQLFAYCLRIPLLDPAVAGGSGDPQTVKLDSSLWLPRINEVLPQLEKNIRFHVGIIVAVVIAVIVYLYLWKTTSGYRMRAAGASDRAARYAGINVKSHLVLAMLISGACCGLAGTVEILGIHHRGLGNCTGGYGFSGIVVALFGGLHPIGVIPAAFFFAVVSYGCSALQINKIPVPSNMIDVLQGLMILVIVAVKMILANPYLLEKAKRKTESLFTKKEDIANV